MEPTIFRYKRWKRRSFWLAAMFAILGLFQIQTLWSSLRRTDAQGMEAVVEAMPFSVLAPPLILVMALDLFATLRPGGLKREYLTLGEDGLTYGNIFRAHRWPWTELSAFALIRRPNKDLAITFAVPGKPGLWLNQLDGKAMIDDVYDTPLEDIVARLNEFRDRTLRDGAADTGAASPRPLPQS